LSLVSRDEIPILAPAETLGGMDRAALAAAMRPLWEEAGPLVDRLMGHAVTSWGQHLDEAEAAVAAMDDVARAELLQAHPRIGAPRAELARRSPLSYREQGGDAHTEPATVRLLDARNDEYEARFGFPFVEWVAGRPKEAIIEVIDLRLTRDRPTELDAGCRALVSIARDRLGRLGRHRV
jgi:2-oxo-4-hydroxy-4-carboxy--5-ureidoimidazoline (OHCU) decarboxylase